MIYSNSMSLVATTANWREVAKDVIGDENVTYQPRTDRDLLRKNPVINIFSEDKSALDRVLTRAALWE